MTLSFTFNSILTTQVPSLVMPVGESTWRPSFVTVGPAWQFWGGGKCWRRPDWTTFSYVGTRKGGTSEGSDGDPPRYMISFTLISWTSGGLGLSSSLRKGKYYILCKMCHIVLLEPTTGNWRSSSGLRGWELYPFTALSPPKNSYQWPSLVLILCT